MKTIRQIKLIAFKVLILAIGMPFFASAAFAIGGLDMRSIGRFNTIEIRSRNGYESLLAQSSLDGELIAVPYSWSEPGQLPLNDKLGYGFIEIYSAKTLRLINVINQVSFQRFTETPLVFSADKSNLIVQSKDGLRVIAVDGSRRSAPILILDQRTVRTYKDFASMQVSPNGDYLMLTTSEFRDRHVMVSSTAEILRVPVADKTTVVTSHMWRNQVYGRFLSNGSIFVIDKDDERMTFENQFGLNITNGSTTEHLPRDNKFAVSADGSVIVSAAPTPATMWVYDGKAKFIRALEFNVSDYKNQIDHRGRLEARHWVISTDSKAVLVEFQVINSSNEPSIFVEFNIESGKVVQTRRAEHILSRTTLISNLKNCVQGLIR